MTLELTTAFRGISSAPAARNGKPAAEAVAQGAAHLRYIDRDSAAGGRASANVTDSDGVVAATPEQVRAAMRERMSVVAEKNGKTGARVMEKGVVSLPNGWPPEACQEAMERVCSHLAPAGSEAMAYAVLHTDKPKNKHFHFAAIDGLESRDAARARRPDAKRVRRANIIRLGDLGRPKELRNEIGAILNGIAQDRGLEGVETRTYEERGIDLTPMKHEGHTRRAVAEKTGVQSAVAIFNQRISTLRDAARARFADFLSKSSVGRVSLDMFDDDEPASAEATNIPVQSKKVEEAPIRDASQSGKLSDDQKSAVQAAARRSAEKKAPASRRRRKSDPDER